jgi:hypothetical protein
MGCFSSGTPTARSVRTSQQGPESGEHLVDVEGFADVVVGSGVQAGDAVGALHARGEHQDRRMVALGTQDATDLEAVDARHHHVEHENVRRPAMGLRKCLHAIGDGRHLVPFKGQGAFQGVADGAVVLGEQHVVGHAASLPRPGIRST